LAENQRSFLRILGAEKQILGCEEVEKTWQAKHLMNKEDIKARNLRSVGSMKLRI
jgi:hypothetical protein